MALKSLLDRHSWTSLLILRHVTSAVKHFPEIMKIKMADNSDNEGETFASILVQIYFVTE